MDSVFVTIILALWCTRKIIAIHKGISGIEVKTVGKINTFFL